ncbi:DUF924-domain-containing protein [Plenodomus tracheiphilus IPT5]|uniref:DUF924-domain-containing protein n=1 Tax=Plenodomus tracheiphilus IPT5 TaxID=1408161 RepID=A0A6A7AXK8_9PLEO|nr:DUF924-domain-containing protein [Plenodomus tracheiphilus IPT5]
MSISNLSPSTSIAYPALEEVLSHAVLESISQFWFHHMDSDHIIALDVEDAGPWFTQTEAFDEECIAQFSPVLKAIKSVEPTGEDIISAANPSTPLHWLSLIILLDQLPRNCFRGAGLEIAYRYFDPLALEVALQAIKSRIPDETSVRFRLTYRFWFYMPMEHSEDMEVQEMLTQAHLRMFADLDMVIASPPVGQDTDVAHCRAVLIKRRASYEKFKATIRGICDSHKSIIRSFGRFPHRNETLGRASTAGELEFLRQKT